MTTTMFNDFFQSKLLKIANDVKPFAIEPQRDYSACNGPITPKTKPTNIFNIKSNEKIKIT